MNKEQLQELKRKFTVNTDETGRFLVYSPRTGITYFVEPLTDGGKRTWGDYDPIQGKTTGGYGEKYTGAIHKSQSMITPENGMTNIQVLPPGVSPHGEIDSVDEVRYAQGFRPGVKPEIS